MPILGSFAGISSKAYGLTSNLVGDYFFIAKSDAPTAAVASLDFSSIPQNFTHLEIRMSVQNTTAGYFDNRMRLNGDSGATQYSYAFNFWDGTTNSNTNTTGQSYIMAGGASGNNNNNNSINIIQLQNYTNTNIFKPYSFINSGYGSAVQRLQLGAGLYKSGSAITSISLFPSANNFSRYSVAYLYGIK